MPNTSKNIPNSFRFIPSFLLTPTSAWADVTAAAAGLLLPLAFAPFHLFPLAVLSPALLFMVWRQTPPGRAAWRGFLFGLGMFGVGTSWVYVSMHNYGNMPAPLAAFATLLWVMGLSLFPGLFGWLQARFFDSLENNSAASVIIERIRNLLLLPALWVLFEWVRGWFLTGFPWLNLGYSQTGWPLSGYAAWVGVYGVSFACVLSAGLLVRMLNERARRWSYYAPALAVLWFMGWLAGGIQWVQPQGEPLRVALVQANVPLERKWNPRDLPAILERYRTLSAGAVDADLIVWPEAALPFYLDRLGPDFARDLKKITQNEKTEFLIGVLERERSVQGMEFYNSVVRFGNGRSVYRKRHLVPFGEFLPFKPLFGWFIENFNIPMSNFSSGNGERRPIKAAGQYIGVSICYEDAFGEELIQFLPAATIFVNVSEDAWFGDSLAPHQRLQMARMRVLESQRPMLRAANTGPSAIIDHRGKIIARSPQFTPFVLQASVQPMQGMTPYARTGNWLIVPLMAFLAAFAFAAGRGHRAIA